MNADLNHLTGSDCERWPLLNGTTVTRHRTDPGRQENLIRLTNASSTAAADSRTRTAAGSITSFARKLLVPYVDMFFYSARNARIASAVLATAIPSVRLSVRLSVGLSVRHTPVLCQNDGT